MPSIQMLSSAEEAKIREDLETYATVDEDGSLMKYLTEMDIVDGDVELRFFATPEQGPVEGIYFEVVVYEDADWYEARLGSRSADNLRNGGPMYEALADELEAIVKDVTGVKPAFVVEKGSSAFTTEVEV